MKDRKQILRLFYLWAYNPKEFFIEILNRFKEKKNSIQVLFIVLSFFFPLLAGTLVFSFLSGFAVIDIANKVLSQSLIWLILVFLSYMLNFLTFLLIPGFSLKYQYYQQGYGNLRIFSRINILRNNLYQIPIIIVMIIVNLTFFRDTWKIYNLGIYLAMVMILIFIWVTIFQVSSLPSIKTQITVENPHTQLIPFYQFGFKAIWSTVFFTTFCFLLNYALGLWLGASEMSLWEKLAMLLLHGN